MAFITSIPLRTSSGKASSTCERITTPLATATKPDPPKKFTAPEPRPFYVRPDKAADIARGSIGQLIRGYAGAIVEGYRIKKENGKLVEYSSTLPLSKPSIPLRLYEFEACPFCRRVREAVSMLDLDVMVFPCPKDGKVYREYVKSKGGKAQFPYLEDPNTDFAGYESSDIIKYLHDTYGPPDGRIPLLIRSAFTFSAGLAMSLRAGRGRKRVQKAVPARLPLELWGYEASPFAVIVREALTELELPYLLRTCARGSVKRAEMKELLGRFQVPYLVDPNTEVKMFESAEIVEYLFSTYGPDASGAVEVPEEGSVYMPGDSPSEEVVSQQSLNPQPSKDEALEKYCAENPDSEECRVYED